MRITQIRNATVKIGYAGKTYLTDPWLAEKGGMGTFRDTPYRCVHPEQESIPMPMCGLPMPIPDLLADVEAIILTHMHPDHIDMAPDGGIGGCLPKALPVFTDNVENAHILLKSGFPDVTVLYANTRFGGASLVWTPCHHGSKIPMCPACGVVLKAPGEKTLYVAGDTIWYDGVKDMLEKHRPDVIIVNACAATLKIYGRLIMGAEDIAKVHAAAPQARIIASHMDTVAHAMITRAGLRKFIEANNLSDSVLIPEDGETVEF